MTWPLRSVAVLIAIAGLVDPAFTTAGHARARVSIIVQDGPTMELPVNGGGGRAAGRNPDGMTRHTVARECGLSS